MIIKNKKETIQVSRNKIDFIEIYVGKKLIWQMIRSCFGKGYWINDKPWINDDLFRNN